MASLAAVRGPAAAVSCRNCSQSRRAQPLAGTPLIRRQWHARAAWELGWGGGRRREALQVRGGVRASSADMGAGAGYGTPSSDRPDEGIVSPTGHSGALRGEGGVDEGGRNVVLAGLMGTLAVVATLAAGAFTYMNGGPAAVQSAIAKTGFTAAFSLVFVSEIGDKTFFIAALLAMKHSKLPVFVGAVSALGLMSLISVAIGRLFQQVPAQLQTTLPIGEYAAIALLLYFGLRSLKTAWDLPSKQAGTAAEGGAEDKGELAEAEELVGAVKVQTPWEVLVESFSIIFAAEWGDRSMLATIALGAAQSPVGVAVGATAGHALATAIAILGGALLANHISEKMVGYVGGILFLAFAVATYLGVF